MKIVIAGAGIIGLSCAYRLALQGATIQIFDPRPPGTGATLASLGALWPASPLATGPLQNLHRQSLWQFPSFAANLAQESRLPVTYRRLGRLELLHSPQAFARAQKEAAAAQSTWPPPPDAPGTTPIMQTLSPQELRSQFPAITAPNHGALLCHATAQVHVPQLVTALLAILRSRGIQIHQSPITNFLEKNNRITAAQTPSGAFEADHFLITAGAWTPLLSPQIAAIAKVRPVKGQALALSRPEATPNLILKSQTTYLVPWANEILVGSTTEPDAAFDETPTDQARTHLLQSAQQLLPALASSQLLRHWTGLRPQNPAKPHPPIMGSHPTLKNLHLCTAHYKTGIGLAPLVSTLMSQSITQGQLPPELQPFVPSSSDL